VGEIAHICGDKPLSARYDKLQSEKERQGFDNLMLMCGHHHNIIDKDEDTYTVAKLKQMKHDHESRATPFNVSDAMVRTIAGGQPSHRWTAAIATVTALALLAVIGLIYVRPPDWLPFQRLPKALEIECSSIASKFPIPDDGRMYFLMPTDKPNIRPGGGMPLFWGEPKSTYTLTGPFRPIEKCEITNYGSEPLIDIELAPRVTFRSVIKTPGAGDQSGPVTSERTWPLIINRIDPGHANRFAFFIANESDKLIEVELPSEAKIRLMGDSNSRTLPIHQSLLTALFQFPAASYEQRQ
jgi:hypothetical protein